MNVRGILIFLGVTYGISFAIQIPLLWSGIESFESVTTIAYWSFAVLLAVPAVGAWIAMKIEPEAERPKTTVWPLPHRPAIQAIFVMPLLFAGIYAACALAGWTGVDTSLSRLTTLTTQTRSLSEDISMFPYLFFLIGLGTSMALGATVYALLVLGTEFGWRGYVLARLLPLGSAKAYGITGVLWGLSFAPIAVSGHFVEGNPILAVIRVCAITVFVGAVLGEAYRRTASIGLSAICMGSFAAHADNGVWGALFVDPVAPWAGAFGVVAIVVWAVVAGVPGIVLGRPAPESPRALESAHTVT